jgi:uncharacterized protein YdeI (YjbR/CyaY-like superfamily)
MIKTETFEQIEVTSADQLRAWLEGNHSQEHSVWLVTHKKHAGSAYVSTSEVLDELLCFGWIDGVRRKLDDHRTMQLIGPRRTLNWAETYKVRVAQLLKAGRMKPAGLASIEQAKLHGAWDAMVDVDALIMPQDLVEALTMRPPAADHFRNFAPSYRRNVLRWIKLAKSPDTRRRRIEQTVSTAAKNVKIPQL